MRAQSPPSTSVNEFMSEHRGAVDDLMRRLYVQSKGKLHQILVADYSVADRLRHVIVPAYPASRRPIAIATEFSWWLLSRSGGSIVALRINALIWWLVGIPSLFLACLRLHPDGFKWQGSTDAPIILLRTGVANEARISKWIQERHGGCVSLLSVNESAACKLSSLRFLPRLIKLHYNVCYGALGDMIELVKINGISKYELDLAAPAWMTLLCRRSINISWSYLWAHINLGQKAPSLLYFTMNYAYESGFMHALPNSQAAYVEHGFPRRDIPPLVCRQFVYSEAYREYLLSFDKSLEVKTIGLAYFPKGQIEPGKSILIASLQDWPQFSVVQVKDIFNAAITSARKWGWKLVFRTRTYDSDAFAKALNGPWDEVSEAADESFDRCLERVKPDMVWTTWSTAVLDASAKGVKSVAFVTEELNNYFVLDLTDFAQVITPGNQRLLELTSYLENFGKFPLQNSVVDL